MRRRQSPASNFLAESLASIDFADHAPALQPRGGEGVVSCAEFCVEHWRLDTPRADTSRNGVLFTVLSGAVECAGERFERGAFLLLPAAASDRTLTPVLADSTVLRTLVPSIG